ncbi:four-carbon acid sugar kinase family protein [Cryobacterium sp. MLB-32]|uniref:four-carbon acid sugar kinase family protein n=1 Tax=Cryobacterium sp. MLB-32 TaxID=1529318 RepID=UPI00068C5461|nr:four-carbon acid sugar kinase family protein [Cryobacterium sp. MLB-32]
MTPAAEPRRYAQALLAGFPTEVAVPAHDVAAAVAATGRVLIVLDDDPTGTQSVADLPVLTQWQPQDFRWALGLGAPAVYVLTNTRSLDPAEAAERNREVVTNALAAADGTPLAFVSRGDSTLRGHFPLEPDVIVETLRAHTGVQIDGVVIVPAFPDAGRVTIDGEHFMLSATDELTPIAETEFARDATFGFTHSRLADYVQEKSGGRIPAASVIEVNLAVLRAGPQAIADAIEPAGSATPIVVDAVTENDLRLLALGLHEAERRGIKLVYRVGPPFVRARIGQAIRQPLTAADAFGHTAPPLAGGLIVVGSHVAMTTRQLEALKRQHASARVVEIDVAALLASESSTHLGEVVDEVVAALAGADVIVQTSRLLVSTTDPAESLRIARTVSAAVVEVVQRVVARTRPRFVIAKGGITSSDVAALGLQIRHAIVRGPMLPGIVSLWQPVDGPATGIPYVVFAGNVGDDESLVTVVRTLSAYAETGAGVTARES